MFINRYLIKFIRGSGIFILKTCILELILTLLSTFFAVGCAFVVRMILGEGSILIFKEIWQVFSFVFIVVMLRFILSKLKAISSAKAGLEIKNNIRKNMLIKLFKLGPSYSNESRTGNIASAITTKVEFLTEYYTMYLPVAVGSILNSILIMVIIFFINPETASICLFGVLGLLFSPMVFYFIMKERGAEEMKMHSEYYSDCLDSIQGMVTLKAYNADERQKSFIHKQGENLRKKIMSQLSITMLENVVLQFFMGIGSAVAIVFGAYKSYAGEISSNNLVYILFLVGACFGPMKNLINGWHFGYRGITASYSISELFDFNVKLDLFPQSFIDNLDSTEEFISAELAEDSKMDIEFKNVNFKYKEGSKNALIDVNINIPANKTTALIGMSGSGKTTIASLISGFYLASSGCISVAGKILDASTVFDIQGKISAIWQDSRMFYGTVEDNIRIGKPSASKDEIYTAARDANIHELIMGLPDGYNTILGENGIRFSGGERQRIALARVFLRDSDIVILDEATSSLDRKNEILIQQSLNKLNNQKTVIVIAHRFETIKNADQIIILDSGRVVDVGSHSKLLARSKFYSQLMATQPSGGQYGE